MQELKSYGKITSGSEILVQGFMAKVYLWMALGLCATGLIAYYTSSSEQILYMLLGKSRLPFFILLGAEIGIVLYLSSRITTLNPATANTLFFVYAALNGLTLAPIFLVYTQESISSAFFSAAATFGAMSAYGTLTKRDLSGLGSFLQMGVIGLLIALLINMFVGNSKADLVISIMGVLIFTGLTAFDTQKLRRLSQELSFREEEQSNLSILGALMLYLDFINMFLFLLRILGRRK